jgi:hypothetical protein
MECLWVRSCIMQKCKKGEGIAFLRVYFFFIGKVEIKSVKNM